MKKYLCVESAIALAGLVVTSHAAALNGDAETYVRCWFKTDDTNTSVKTASDWAQAPNGGGDYVLRGDWHTDGVTDIQNMFFTNTTPAELTSLCNATLARRGKSLLKVSAADRSNSYDYTIWSNDPADQPEHINKVVVFGDSVSDNGNLWNFTRYLIPNQVPNSDSWLLGRFSNGKVWNEYLSDSLGLPNYNWAVGGAAGDALLRTVPSAVAQVESVVAQVKSYTTYMASAPNYKPQNTLFTMLIGANDLITYGQTPATAVAAEEMALNALIESGARYIVVGNLPALWKAPEYRLRSEGERTVLKGQIEEFNARLSTLVATLRAQATAKQVALSIELFDIQSAVDDMLANPERYGVTNTSESCLDLPESSVSNYLNAHALRPSCSDPDRFLFWDLLHPTTSAHRVIGEQAAALVRAKFPLQ